MLHRKLFKSMLNLRIFRSDSFGGLSSEYVSLNNNSLNYAFAFGSVCECGSAVQCSVAEQWAIGDKSVN